MSWGRVYLLGVYFGNRGNGVSSSRVLLFSEIIGAVLKRKIFSFKEYCFFLREI